MFMVGYFLECFRMVRWLFEDIVKKLFKTLKIKIILMIIRSFEIKIIEKF